MKEKKSRIDKHISKNEVIIERFKMARSACIPRALAWGFALIAVAFSIYALISLGYSNTLVAPSVLAKISKLKGAKFEWAYLTMLFYIVPLLIFFVSQLIWMIRNATREAVLTDRRFIMFDTAFIHDYTFSFNIDQIREIMSKQGFVGKIFKYGEIYIGTGNETVGLPGFKNYIEVANKIEEVVAEKKTKKSTTSTATENA